jgi:hypothetical protein
MAVGPWRGLRLTNEALFSDADGSGPSPGRKST